MSEDQTLETTTSNETTTQDSGFSVPEAYADRGWVEKIKSSDDLWKTLDNAQSLLGKRPEGIPAKDALQEEWDKFYRTIGRPDDPNGYEFDNNFEGLPEGLDLAPYEEKAKGFFHELGLSKEKANEAWRKYVAMEMEAVGQMTESQKAQQAELDKQFNDMTSKMYGNKFEEVSKQAQEFIGQALPDELKPVMERIGDDPQALVAMIELSNYAQKQIADVKRQYTGEDNLTSGGTGANQSADEVRARMGEIRLALKNADPLSKQRKELEAELEDKRKSLASMVR